MDGTVEEDVPCKAGGKFGSVVAGICGMTRTGEVSGGFRFTTWPSVADDGVV